MLGHKTALSPVLLVKLPPWIYNKAASLPTGKATSKSCLLVALSYPGLIQYLYQKVDPSPQQRVGEPVRHLSRLLRVQKNDNWGQREAACASLMLGDEGDWRQIK